jgi:hypothetical protein
MWLSGTKADLARPDMMALPILPTPITPIFILAFFK